jgi:hypothetical protein
MTCRVCNVWGGVTVAAQVANWMVSNHSSV